MRAGGDAANGEAYLSSTGISAAGPDHYIGWKKVPLLPFAVGALEVFLAAAEATPSSASPATRGR
jgi:hypothetical protein